jgi:Flp pilus assembly secretin CpaC
MYVYFRNIRSYVAGAALLGVLGGTVPATADQPTILSVQTGHSVVLDVAGLSRVAVGDGRIAGVVPIGTSQVVINGKSSGHTTIFIWTSQGRQTYEVTVTEQAFDDIAKLLRTAINEPDVQVVAFGANMVVRGTVPDSAAFARLNEVIDRFKGAKFTNTAGKDGVILNTVSIAHPLGDLPNELSQIAGATGVRIDPDAKGNVIISGSVHDRTTAEHILDKVKGLAGPYLSTDGKIIDRLALDTVSQVDVKVYVVEVDRTASSQLGLRLQTATIGGGTTSVTPTANQGWTISSSTSLIGVENPDPSSFFGRVFGVGNIARITQLAPTLDLMMTQGHAHLLSAPELVTTPGNEATFLVGGQIPIPVSSGLGTVSITYKDYGVNLKMTPTLLGNGDIETKLNPEVSELDTANGVNLNGFTVPGLKVSRLSTDVITQSGESIVLGGLLSRVSQKTIQKIPILGDLPILGQLFRSTTYLRQDSDVIFVMTPTIVTR